MLFFYRVLAAAFAAFMTYRLFSGIHVNHHYLDDTEYGALDKWSGNPRNLTAKVL